MLCIHAYLTVINICGDKNVNPKIKEKIDLMVLGLRRCVVRCFISVEAEPKPVLKRYLSVHWDVWILEKREAVVVPPDRPDPTSESKVGSRLPSKRPLWLVSRKKLVCYELTEY